MKKKALSLLLVLSLCLTLLPTAALATENTTEPSTEQTETTPVPEEQATPPAPPEPETPNQSEDTKTPDQPEDTKTPDQSEDTKTPDQPEDAKTPDQSEDAKTPDQPEDTKTPDQSEDTKTPDQSEDTKTPDQPEEPPQDEEPPAAEEFAPVGETFYAAAATEEAHTHPICGDANCSKHDASFSDWKGIADISSTMTAGRYYLTQDVTIYSTWKPKDGVVLCLNGHSITLGSRTQNVEAGSYDVIMVEADVTFTLCDCKDEHDNYGTIGHYDPTGNQGHGVNVRGGTFNMYGGKISNNLSNSYTGNTGGYGGGVLVSNQGTFNMIGGEITGNTAKSGGGVVVGSAYGIHENTEQDIGGTFNMTGGKIYKNIATSNGGGVYACASSKLKFTVSGAAQITDNHLNNSGGKANNVYLQQYTNSNNQTFTATIQVVSPLDDSAHINVSTAGGTQLVASGVSETDKGRFFCDNNTDCKLEHDATNQTLTLVTAHGKHPICGLNCTQDKAKDWTGIASLSEIDTSKKGFYYYLTQDIELSQTWKPASGVVLCLNGHSITMSADKDAIEVSGEFTLTDCNSSNGSKKFTKNSTTGLWELDSSGDIAVNGGAIFHQKDKSGCGVNVSKGGTFNMYGGKIAGNAANGGGVYVGGTFNMSGGTICGNTAKTSSSSSSNSKSSSGGGVCVAKNGNFTMSGSAAITDNTGNFGGGVYVNDGTFTMNGGTISGNKTHPNSGGGVYVNNSGTFTMNGGTISDNTANNYGGGVFVEASNNASSTFEMTGGTICGNTVNNYGGGVSVENGGTFNMSGNATITGNNASSKGGGVYFGSGTFNMSGKVTITDNWKNGTKNTKSGVYEKGDNGSANNLYLAEDKSVIITESLNQYARIGVTTAKAPTHTLIASGAKGTVDYKKIFTPDEAGKGYAISKRSDSSDIYLVAHQHSWGYTLSKDKTTITATCTNDGCPLTNKIGGTLTLVPPTDLTYDGSPKRPTIQPDTAWTTNIGAWNGSTTYYRNDTNVDSPTDAGDYKVKCWVTGSENAAAEVTYTIEKATPTAEDFNFSGPAPTDLTYNGNPKTATVTSSKIGMGEVTVRYYQGDTLVEKPTNAGKYTVKISVADGTNYTAANNLSDSDWKFAITKADPTLPTGLIGVTGKKLSTVELPTDWSWTNGDTVLGAEGSYTFDASYAGDDNHNSTAAKLTVTVSNKSVDNHTLSLTQASMTYGQGELPAYELTNKPEKAGEDRVHYAGKLRTGNSYNSAEKPTQAGSYTVTVTCETADTVYTASASFTIDPINLGDGNHGVGFSSPEITYTGEEKNASVHPLGPNGSPQMTTGTDYEISGTVSATNVGEYTVTIRGIGNNYTGQVSGTWQIIPAPLTISGAAVTAKTYDGSTSAQVTGVTFTGLKNNEELELDTDYEVTAAAFNDANVNAANKVTGTVALKDTETAKNYTLSSATFEQAANIGKAPFTQPPTKTIPIVKNRTAPQTGTLTAADFFPAGQAPAGAVITHVTPGSGTLMITVALNGGQFSYDSKCNLSDAADETYTVTIATTNYTDIAAKLTFHLTDKETVTIFGLTYTDKTYDGQPIAPTGALVVSGDKVPVSELEVLYTSTGSTAYQSADAPKNAGTYQVTYSVAESNESCIGSAVYSFTIAPKPVTVAPKSLSITKGDALPAFELVCNGLVQGETLTPSVQPAFTCFESDGTTAVTANTAAGTYAITWTNADATTFSDANYTVTKEAAGTLTITARGSSGGGGGGGGSSVTTYPVNTPSKTQSGSVTSTLKNASKGDTVTIIVKPDRGYVLDGLTVTDRSGNALKLTDLGDGKYTFTMPAGKVDVNAAFVPETVSSPFADVSTDSYYAQPVQWAADRGITGGISKDSFGPDRSCTRAQIITFLWRAAGSPETESTVRFSDVSADSYYAKAVAWAVEHGITSGTGSGTFDPDAPCTRAQSVTFLYRALGQLADGQSAFGDVPADSYYADAVAWAVERGITSGIGGGLFGPDHACTRAQIVTFLYKTYQGA